MGSRKYFRRFIRLCLFAGLAVTLFVTARRAGAFEDEGPVFSSAAAVDSLHCDQPHFTPVNGRRPPWLSLFGFASSQAGACCSGPQPSVAATSCSATALSFCPLRC